MRWYHFDDFHAPNYGETQHRYRGFSVGPVGPDVTSSGFAHLGAGWASVHSKQLRQCCHDPWIDIGFKVVDNIPMYSSWIRSNLTCIILYRVMYLLWFPVWKHHTSWGRAFGRGTGRMVSSGPKYPKCAHALAMSVSDRPGVQTHGILCLNLEGGVVWSWGSPKWLVYFMEKSYLEAGWRWLTFFCNAMQRLQCHVHNMNWSDTRAESEVTKLTWDMIWYDMIWYSYMRDLSKLTQMSCTACDPHSILSMRRSVASAAVLALRPQKPGQLY